ncbi:hypothetical protein A2160_04600 [Candidatus Beckwithbacteria bacterium RBG_13_42_9]|uniref:Uncharacterized protein n=1 Tax=Candidatus Beckwithbacteria bacterium RBG_13_42_9 TaxID=1797457 RepID=A0A1F5E9T2_9BACT|nr:MAG: hypothetical protein A2160_04600 [Candidatus Beckwithbacteria bacterium RBG_13_42_9]
MLRMETRSTNSSSPLPISNFFQRFLAILGFVFFANLFFFHAFGAVAFVFLSLGLFSLTGAIFFEKSLIKKQFLSLAGILVSLLLLSGNIVRIDNQFGQFLSGIGIVFLLTIFTYLLSTQLIFVRCLMELVLAPFYTFWAYIVSGFKFMGLIFSGQWQARLDFHQNQPKLSGWKSILTGLLVALPVLAVLLSLLSSADPIFSHFVKDILSEDFIKDLPARLFLSLLIFTLLIPLTLFVRKKEFVSPLNVLQRFSWVQEISVVMGLVILIMAVYLVVQWPYVFANVPFETDLSRFGVATYSEYVKRGFGELIEVALLVFGLSWIGVIILRGKKPNQKTILPLIQLLLFSEFALLIASLFRRIWLYQSFHGWSLARIYGGFLLVWLISMMLTLTARLFWQKRWVLAEALFSVTVLFLVGFFNAENFIATHHPPTVNKRVDYIYLARMSADGYQGWQQAFSKAQEVLFKSGLENKEMINKEERREVAYAGIILGQLSENYHWLIKEYGKEPEFRAYLQAVFAEQKNSNDEYLNRLAARKEKMGTAGNQEARNLDYLWQEALKEKKYLEESLGQLNNKDTDWQKLKFNLSLISFSRLSMVNQFADQVDDDNSFYRSGEKEAVYVQNQGLDRIFTWNASRAKAYQSMKMEIDYHQLLSLQRKYWQLYRKISSQPQEERDYETDISFDSPFLQ